MVHRHTLMFTVSGLLVGFVCGVASTRIFMPIPEEYIEDHSMARSPIPAQSPQPSTNCPEPASIFTEGEELRLTEKNLITALEYASDPLSGPPPEWPESNKYRASIVRASLTEAFPNTSILLDCSEFPCVGVIEFGDEDSPELADSLASHGLPLEAYQRLGEYLEAEGLEDMTISFTQRPLEDGSHRMLVSWLSKERDTEISARLQARFDWLAEHGLEQDSE